MPYEIIYKKAEGVVVTNYSGVLTDKEFRDCTAEKFSAYEEVKTYRYSLSDLTDLKSFEVSVEAVKESALASKRALEENPTGVMVVVAPEDFAFGMSRLWGGRAEDTLERVKVFRTRGEADEWISDKMNGPSECS
ncbi:MAG: hypothetical protein AB8B95_14515 [Pseudohongiellaceae bacterium]